MRLENQIRIIGLKNIPLIKKGDNLAKIILNNLKINEISLDNGDLIVIAQTIISKNNGRIRSLNDIKPSDKALELYAKITPKTKKCCLPIKDPKFIQAILDESREIIKAEHVLITETNHGFICANAGIDKSNVGVKDHITLLPENSDEEAEKIKRDMKKIANKDVGVIITDSFGRPFRVGSVGVALGVSGINPLLDKRGEKDLFGFELQTTIVGQVDNLASAAQLVMGESNEGIPIVLIKGYKYNLTESTTINSIIRDKNLDLFRETQGKTFSEILRKRRSYKIPFEDKEIDMKIITECIKLARWAPSAHNGQYWRYIIIKKTSLRKKLIENMNIKLKNDLQKADRSEEYIKSKINKTRNNFLNAPILILLCLDSNDLEKYPDHERTQNEFILGIQSISSSATCLLLAFEMKKLAACWYCAPLFAKDVIKKTLNLPQSYVPMALFTVGYPKTSIKPPSRKDVNDIIYELNQ